MTSYKILLLFLVVILTSVNVRAQEITMFNGWFGNKYYQDDIKLTGAELTGLMAADLLINIIIIAILSSPFPFQQFAFERPNIGMMHFPFIWLPAFVAPAVLFSHFASIMILIKRPKE